MSSTSTNKQPALIDRPFIRGARVTGSFPIVDEVNPSFNGLLQLVRVGDLPSEDAALVEDIFLVSSEKFPDTDARTAAFGVYIYAPNQAAPSTSAALLVSQIEVGLSGITAGIPLHLELPFINAPQPKVADTSLGGAAAIGKMEGLYLEKGYILAIGYLGAGPGGTDGGLGASGVSVFAQGGFY